MFQVRVASGRFPMHALCATGTGKAERNRSVPELELEVYNFKLKYGSTSSRTSRAGEPKILTVKDPALNACIQ